MTSDSPYHQHPVGWTAASTTSLPRRLPEHTHFLLPHPYRIRSEKPP